MSLSGIKALTFDTGGTVLDWHTGFREAFAAAGARHGITRDWRALTNDLRRRSMEAMLDLGRDGPPAYNFDEAHRFCLDALLADEGLDAFDEADRRAIAWDTPHSFTAWPDVKPGLTALRNRYIVASFTLLSYRLVIDSSRRNGLIWDAVLSCEGLGVYKLLPQAYLRAAKMLQLAPEDCLMVACHPFDLDAAAKVGFRTALIRRPTEWGVQAEGLPDLPPSGTYDVEVDSVLELDARLSQGS
ncbi:hypothetical protein AVO45_18490 [Ruegeria marisrubri]|uniref:Haloacid dehalogenase n=1 Tax=Ruegeria marisrubri TaxID=1685379 RepID=A0A0X3U7K7_9RHOB|nr:HAD family hydrolase [Ruegeria marisrubri]KUJ84088.1 hypothetical protein AVO45_18490 [Ruegeria marisrubri]